MLIGDTGLSPRDRTTLQAEYPRLRCVDVGPIQALERGFSEARNRVLDAATGEWFCWVDTDEVLVGHEQLHKYLEGGVFVGYALKQHHLMLDVPKTFDTPMRVFRRVPTIRFYGCIHEQPQMGDANGDITPSLQLHDVEIAHVLGYLTEAIRRQKCLTRNLPLLVRDQQMFPDRRLGKLLVLRDLVNLGTWAREAAGGALTDDAKRYYQQAIGLFEQHFVDPSDKHYALARPFYEAALQPVDGAWEAEIAFAARQGGLGKGRAKSERVWVRTREDLAALVAHRAQTWVPTVEPPIDVEPVGGVALPQEAVA